MMLSRLAIKAWLPYAFALLALYAGPAQAAAPETTNPIKLAIVNAPDNDFIVHVLGNIYKKMGYNVEYVTVDYVAQFAAIDTGDIHISFGWETSVWDIMQNSVTKGKGTLYGSTGIFSEEGWWFPNYAKALCPGLPDWEALKAESCVQAFAVAETAPKGRYVDAPADWGQKAQERVEKLGLQFEVINSGSPAALAATLRGAFERKEPILAFAYFPHWVVKRDDGEFVKWPDISPAGFIWKIGNTEFMNTIPAARRLLFLFALDAPTVGAAMDRIDNSGETAEAVAADWIAKNESTWKSWLR